MKRVILILLFVWPFFGLVITYGQIEPPSASPNVSSFSMAPDNIGAAQSSVNLFTGDVHLPLNLVSFTSREGLGVNVAISYSSNVQNHVDTWNLEAPTGILGLGWSMDMPRIVCDHKSTGSREDDTFYIIEGGISNRLIRTGSGTDATGSFNAYQTKKYQFWQIKFYYDPADYNQSGAGASQWVIVKENGFKYVYGDKNSGRNTIQYVVRWNNWIGNSANTSGQSQMAYAWNLSEVVNLLGEKTTYEYMNVESSVGIGGLKHTEASYLKQITDPVGKKVQFFYNDKDAQYYMEPHTEQGEPDAYQEVYEKKYLERIEAYQEGNNKFLSVHFSYSSINSGNTAKMLLTGIVTRNSSGLVQPGTGLLLDYYMSTTANGYKGFLQKITYATGATASYTYQMTNNAIGHSKRDFAATAPPADYQGPNGYAEPSMWFGPDYIVVAWRALGSGGSHNAGNSPVRVYIYQWVGEWKSTFIHTIFNIKANFVTDQGSITAVHYNDFQVVMEPNFCAILAKPYSYHELYIIYKDDSRRGKWWMYGTFNGIEPPSTNPKLLDLGSERPTLLSGEDFVAVGSYANDNTYRSHVYTFIGDNFMDTPMTGTYGVSSGNSGKNYYTSANNYFINFYDLRPFPLPSLLPQITLSYLNEEKKWMYSIVPTGLGYAGYNGSFYSPSTWFGSQSFAVAMAGQNPEYIYRWDINYLNFIRDNGGSSLFGYWDDNSYVFNIDNSLVGFVDYHVNRKGARFDGNNWLVSSNYTAAQPRSVAVGMDFMVNGSSDNTKLYLSEFNPNGSYWTQSIINSPSPAVSSKAGYNLFFSGGKAYRRRTNGTWNSDNVSYRLFDGSWFSGSYDGTLAGKCVVGTFWSWYLKNGGVAEKALNIGNLSGFRYADYDQFGILTYRSLVGNNMIVKWDGYGRYPDATKLLFYYAINEDVIGKQVDYPVNTIVLGSPNEQDQNVAFEYNFTTAAIDPTGSVAQYAEVSVALGTLVASSKPNGSTKTFFNNGLSTSDDGGISITSDLRDVGNSYQTFVKDNANNIVASSSTMNLFETVPIYNSQGTKVDVAFWARPSVLGQSADGTGFTMIYTYDLASGQVRTQTKIASATEVTEYVYWYEKYDPSKSRNLLSLPIQVSQKINGKYTESQVTRCKYWTAGLTGSTFPAPVDNYYWKRTGDLPNSFSAWDASLQPPSNWQFVNSITKRDNFSGIAIENVSKDNIRAANIVDQYKIRSLAQVINSAYDLCAYSGFEDNTNGNWTVSGCTYGIGNAKTGTRYLNIGTGTISKSGLNPSEKYTVSFWAKTTAGSLTVDGVGTVNLGNLSDWSLFEYVVTGISGCSIRLSGSQGVQLDDVRIHPNNARMSTSCYDPLFGPTSQTDANNQTIYIEYDQFGRQKLTRDDARNVLSSTSYKTGN